MNTNVNKTEDSLDINNLNKSKEEVKSFKSPKKKIKLQRSISSNKKRVRKKRRLKAQK